MVYGNETWTCQRWIKRQPIKPLFLMHERETTDEAIYICDNDDDLGGFCLDNNQNISVSEQLSGSSKIKVYPLTNFIDDTKTTKERNANAIEGSESDGDATGPPTKFLKKI